jgi:hypothetical protein
MAPLQLRSNVRLLHQHMMNRLLAWPAVAAVALSAPTASAQRTVVGRQRTALARHWAATEFVVPQTNGLPRRPPNDTSGRQSHRSAIVGGVVGAAMGGLATAAYVLNATAYDCVTQGPPCPKKNYVVLHVSTITAGATAGALLGVRVGRWISRRL